MAKKDEGASPLMKQVFEEVLQVLHESAETPPPEDVDYDQAIAELEKSLTELREKAEEVYRSTGMSKEQLEEYAANPDNFSKEEWEMLEKIRGELHAIQDEADAALQGDAPKKRKKAPRKKKWISS